jgi:ABC-type Fe3+-siderophore transport system permease subunit
MSNNERNATSAPNRKFFLELCALLAAFLIVAILAAGAGAVAIPGREVLAILFRHLGFTHAPPYWPSSDEVILLQIRLPRVLGAALVGAALSVAGTLFQGLLRNPMADPFVIGTSGGAALGGTLGVLLATRVSVLGFGAVPALAFLGALGTMVIVYRLSRVGGQTPVVNLLLAGFAMSVILSYAMSLLLILNDRLQLHTRVVYAWLLGGISVTHWSQVGVIAVLVLGGITLSFAFGSSLNALSLGDETAQQLGIPVERHRAAIIATGSVLTAAAVSGGGMIGFVGLIVPHFLRLLFGPNHNRLLPLAATGGATFLVFADLLARMAIPPTELPVGILTAFIGGPAFLVLLRRTKQEYRF